MRYLGGETLALAEVKVEMVLRLRARPYKKGNRAAADGTLTQRLLTGRESFSETTAATRWVVRLRGPMLSP